MIKDGEYVVDAFLVRSGSCFRSRRAGASDRLYVGEEIRVKYSRLMRILEHL